MGFVSLDFRLVLEPEIRFKLEHYRWGTGRLDRSVSFGPVLGVENRFEYTCQQKFPNMAQLLSFEMN